MTDPSPAPSDAAPAKPTAPPPAAPSSTVAAPASATPGTAAAASVPPISPAAIATAPLAPKPATEPAKPTPAAEASKPADAAKPAPAKPSAPPPAAPPRAAAPPPSPPPPAPPPAAGSSQAMRSALPVLTAIGFIFVFLGLVWIWNSQQELGRQLADLAARPAPALPPMVEPARVTALEARVTGLEQRISALETRPAPAPAPSLSSDNAAALAGQLSDLEGRLKAAEQKEGTLAQREALAQLLQQAQTALEAGQPLGDIPDAPPALVRFAHARPPTEASLRLAFPAAAAAAEAASRPSADGKTLGERVLMHVSSLFTVKQGNRVVVGAPAVTVLGAAQARLEAGDLAGALAALDGLDSSAAAAMADWRAQAKALLDARAALAQMARG